MFPQRVRALIGLVIFAAFAPAGRSAATELQPPRVMDRKFPQLQFCPLPIDLRFVADGPTATLRFSTRTVNYYHDNNGQAQWAEQSIDNVCVARDDVYQANQVVLGSYSGSCYVGNQLFATLDFQSAGVLPLEELFSTDPSGRGWDLSHGAYWNPSRTAPHDPGTELDFTPAGCLGLGPSNPPFALTDSAFTTVQVTGLTKYDAYHLTGWWYTGEIELDDVFLTVAVLSNDPPPGPGWRPNGSPASAAAGTQQQPTTVSDARGGAILAWEDYRAHAPVVASESAGRVLGPGGARVFTVRLNELGEVASGWTAGGLPLADGPQNEVQPDCTTDGASGAITVWTDDRNGNLDIYAQRVTGSAAIPGGWTAGGVALCTAAQGQQRPAIVSDGQGGGIAVWEDFRSGTSVDLYAQRVRSNGAIAWTANGVSISAAPGAQDAAVIIPDNSGGAVIAWTDRRGANANIHASHVDANGARVGGWPGDGLVLCNATLDQVDPAIAPDGAGGAIVAWTDGRGVDLDIYAQRVNGAGVPQWTANGVVVCNAAGNQQRPRITADGSGGVIVTWEDSRPGAPGFTIDSQGIDLYAMRVQSNGVRDNLWTANGAALCTAAGDQHDAVVIADGGGGAIVSWVDERNAAADVYATQIRHDGTLDPRYALNGSPLTTATGSQNALAITTDGLGGAIVGWTDGRVVEPDIYAMHLFGSAFPSTTDVGMNRRVLDTLLAAYPNPSVRAVNLSFTLPADGPVTLEVLDLAGRRVVRLTEGERFAAGVHTLLWNGADERGGIAAAGIYFVRCTIGSEMSVRRFVLMR